MAIVPVDNTFGYEASGVIRRVGPGVQHLRVGDRVMALAGGTFATSVKTTELLCVKIPDSLGFDDAATIPIVYTTAAYSLFDIGGLRKGQVRTSCPSPPNASS